MAVYQRILLKVSGEALAGKRGYGLDPVSLDVLSRELDAVHRAGIQAALVVGGGNILRGVRASAEGMDRVTSDSIGMLATIINGLALKDALGKIGISATIQSARAVEELAEPVTIREALNNLNDGKMVIFVGGTGNPFFSTDTAASLRAAQIGAEVILKGTKVDGVFDGDPLKNPSCKKFDTITFDEVLSRGLQVMDATAIAMCRENNIPIVVFNLMKEGTLLRIVNGDMVGTVIKEGKHG
jgi:uridylate kinase